MIGELLALSELLARRAWPRQRIAALRDQRLRRLVADAWQRVPGFRDSLEHAGLRPGDVHGAADLARLPLMTKDTLRAAGRAAIARDVDLASCTAHRTSGSSGEPFTTLASPDELRTRSLVRLRALLSVGLRPRDRLAVLGPTELHRRRPHERLGLFWCENVSLAQPIEDQVRRLREISPTILWVFPTVLRAVLDRVDGKLSRICRPRLIVSSAEVLDDVLRRQLREDIGVPIRQLYVTTELGCIAWQCGAGDGLHVNEDQVILERLADDGRPARPGEPGVVAATALGARTMPLVRYRLGDRIAPVLGDCPCGSAFARIAPPLGRENDLVRLPSGRTLSPLRFGDLLEEIADVRQWRVRQTHADRLVVELHCPTAPAPAALERTRARVLEHLGEAVRVELALRAFPREPGVKFRVFVSELACP